MRQIALGIIVLVMAGTLRNVWLTVIQMLAGLLLIYIGWRKLHQPVHPPEIAPSRPHSTQLSGPPLDGQGENAETLKSETLK